MAATRETDGNVKISASVMTESFEARLLWLSRYRFTDRVGADGCLRWASLRDVANQEPAYRIEKEVGDQVLRARCEPVPPPPSIHRLLRSECLN